MKKIVMIHENNAAIHDINIVIQDHNVIIFYTIIKYHNAVIYNTAVMQERFAVKQGQNEVILDHTAVL